MVKNLNGADSFREATINSAVVINEGLGFESTQGTNGQVLTMVNGEPVFTTLSAGVTVDSAINLAGGAAGQVPYQSAINTTSFTATGGAGQLLQSNGASAPTWVNQPPALNLAGGTAGQVSYQTAPNTTSFTATGGVGQLLQSNGVLAPTWVNPPTVAVGDASSLLGGSAGRILYQSATDLTAFVEVGSEGEILVAHGTSAPTFEPQSSLSVGYATTAGSATNATNATNAINATNAVFATSATNATTAAGASYATTAGSATSATTATSAAQISGGTANTVVIQNDLNQTSFTNQPVPGVGVFSLLQGHPTLGIEFKNDATISYFNIKEDLLLESVISSTYLKTNAAGLVRGVTGGPGLFYQPSSGDAEFVQATGDFRAVSVLCGNESGQPAFKDVVSVNALTTNLALSSTGTFSVTGATSLLGATIMSGLTAVQGALSVTGTTFTVGAGVATIEVAGPATFTSTAGLTTLGSLLKLNDVAINGKNVNITANSFPGIDGKIFLFGTVVVNNIRNKIIYCNNDGEMEGADINNTTVGYANNLRDGVLGSVPYQVAPNDTAMLAPGTLNMFLQCNGGAAPSWSDWLQIPKLTVTGAGNTTTAAAMFTPSSGPGFITSTSTVGPAAIFRQTNPFEESFINFKTTSTDAYFGLATTGEAYIKSLTSDIILNGLGVKIPSLVNAPLVKADGTGKLFPVVLPPDSVLTTNNLGVVGGVSGANGYILQSKGPGVAPIFVDPAVIPSGIASNLNGGVAQALPYQSAPNTTAFLAPGSPGQVLIMSPTNTLSWNAYKPVNIAGGLEGDLLVQISPGITSFLPKGVTGYHVKAGATGPVYSNVGTFDSITVDTATSAPETITSSCKNPFGICYKANLNSGSDVAFYSYQPNNSQNNRIVLGTPTREAKIGLETTNQLLIDTNVQLNLDAPTLKLTLTDINNSVLCVDNTGLVTPVRGASNLVLTSNGPTAVPSYQIVPRSRAPKLTAYTSLSLTNHTFESDCTYYEIYMCGGGGGAAGTFYSAPAVSAWSGGAGGGAATGYYISSAFPTRTISIWLGAGGAAGGSNFSGGSSGVNSSIWLNGYIPFTLPDLTALAGGGGGGQQHGDGGSGGGWSANWTFVYNGDDGESGWQSASDSIQNPGGNRGGRSYFGAGTGSSSAAQAAAYGAGGGVRTGMRNGGGNGYIQIREYFT